MAQILPQWRSLSTPSLIIYSDQYHSVITLLHSVISESKPAICSLEEWRVWPPGHCLARMILILCLEVRGSRTSRLTWVRLGFDLGLTCSRQNVRALSHLSALPDVFPLCQPVCSTVTTCDGGTNYASTMFLKTVRHNRNLSTRLFKRDPCNWVVNGDSD